MSSRIETLVKALLNGETVNVKPRSRVEKCLKACVDGTGTEGLPTPRSRVEVLLHQLADKLATGGGAPKKLATPVIRLHETT